MAETTSKKKSMRELVLNKPSHWYQALYDPQEVNASFDHYVLFVLISAGLKRVGRASKGQHIFMLAQPSFSAREVDLLAKEVFLAGAGRFTMEYVPVATAYGMNRSTALVVSLGERHTFVSPVINGELYHAGVRRSAVNGYLVTRYLRESLLGGEASYATAKALKEHHAKVCENYRKEEEAAKGRLVRVPTLSGSKETVSLHALLTCGESYFRPRLVREVYEGEDSRASGELDWENGLHKLVQMSIAQCPSEYHLQLCANILIEGDGARFAGLVDRLRIELASALLRTEVVVKVCPRYIAWGGAAMLSTSLQSKTLSREEYQHSSIKRAKCLARLHHPNMIGIHRPLSSHIKRQVMLGSELTDLALLPPRGDLAVATALHHDVSSDTSNELPYGNDDQDHSREPHTPSSESQGRPARSSHPRHAVLGTSITPDSDDPLHQQSYSTSGTPREHTDDEEVHKEPVLPEPPGHRRLAVRVSGRAVPPRSRRPRTSSSSKSYSSSSSTRTPSPQLQPTGPDFGSTSQEGSTSDSEPAAPSRPFKLSTSPSLPAHDSKPDYTVEVRGIAPAPLAGKPKFAKVSSTVDLAPSSVAKQNATSSSPLPSTSTASSSSSSHEFFQATSDTIATQTPSMKATGSPAPSRQIGSEHTESVSSSDASKSNVPPNLARLNALFNESSQLLFAAEDHTSLTTSETAEDDDAAAAETTSEIVSEGIVSSHALDRFRRYVLQDHDSSSSATISSSSDPPPLPPATLIARRALRSHESSRSMEFSMHVATIVEVEQEESSAPSIKPTQRAERRVAEPGRPGKKLSNPDPALHPRLPASLELIDHISGSPSNSVSSLNSIESRASVDSRPSVEITQSRESPPARLVVRPSASASNQGRSAAPVPSSPSKALSRNKKWKALAEGDESATTPPRRRRPQGSQTDSPAADLASQASSSTSGPIESESSSHGAVRRVSSSKSTKLSSSQKTSTSPDRGTTSSPPKNQVPDTRVATSVIRATAPHEDVGTDHIKAKPELPPKPNLNLQYLCIRFHEPLENHIRTYWLFLKEKVTPFVIQQMKNREFLEGFVLRRYQRFVHLKQTSEPSTSDHLIPDIFIEIAWQSHMARPLHYRDYSTKHYNGKILAHSLPDLVLAHEVDKNLLDITQKAWKKSWNGESYIKTMPTDAAINSGVSSPVPPPKPSKTKSKNKLDASSTSTTSNTSSPPSSPHPSAKLFNWKKIKPETKGSKASTLPPLGFDLAAAIIEDLESHSAYTTSLRKASSGAFTRKTLLQPRTLAVLCKAYEQFFFLLLKYASKYNMVYFRPPPFLAMIWKAHMLAPQLYVSDVKTYSSHLVAQASAESSHDFERSVKTLNSMGVSVLPKTKAEFLTSLAIHEFGGPLENVIKPCPALPVEILVYIFKKLPTRVVAHRSVCTAWARAASVPEVWVSHVRHDFPPLVCNLPTDQAHVEGFYHDMLNEALGDAVVFDVGSSKVRCGAASDTSAGPSGSSMDSSLIEDDEDTSSDEGATRQTSSSGRWHGNVWVASSPHFIYQAAVRRAISKRPRQR